MGTESKTTMSDDSRKRKRENTEGDDTESYSDVGGTESSSDVGGTESYSDVEELEYVPPDTLEDALVELEDTRNKWILARRKFRGQWEKAKHAEEMIKYDAETHKKELLEKEQLVAATYESRLLEQAQQLAANEEIIAQLQLALESGAAAPPS